MFHKMGLPLLAMFLAIGLQDGAAGLHLNTGPDACGEDSHSSCDLWVKSGECEKDPEVKQSCSFSCSLSGQLWEAAWTGNKSTVEITIAAGANPLCTKTSNVTGDNLYNYTGIHMAALAGHPSIIHTLLEAGVDVNLQTTEGKTPIYIAAQKGNIDALDILIENNANVNIPDSDGWTWTPLMRAASMGAAYDIARALIKANASLDVTGGDWNATALHHAVWNSNQDMVLLLIEHNANVNIPDSNGDTPLMAAAINGELNITRALIKANASIDVTGGLLGRRATALYHAVLGGNQDAVLLLIEHNANVNIPQSDGWTPLMAAAYNGELNITRVLIKANASLDVTGGRAHATALHYAVLKRNQDIALLLIEHNANVNIPSSGGMTPLMPAELILAAERGELNITRALVSANSTVLHYAAEDNNQDMVVLLMDNGADSRIQNNLGYTPADLARSEGHNQLADLIESYPTTHRLILTG